MKILSIVDNVSSENKSLVNEHGLSIYIKGNYNNVLFDFGQGENTFKNFKNLNLDPEDIDKAVISHNHYDHTNGLIEFVEYMEGKDLILGRDFFHEKYAKVGGTYSYLGSNFSKKDLLENNININTCEDIYEIDEQIYVVGGFIDGASNNKINSRFYVSRDEKLLTDDFSDEIALVIRQEIGLSVVLGCSHPGVMLILNSIKERFNRPILNVFGGTHLIESDSREIKNVSGELKDLGVKNIYFSHCSGDEALDIFANIEGIKASPLYTGSKVFL